MHDSTRLIKSIRAWIIFFIIALVLSGCTAFALETELAWLDQLFPNGQTNLRLWVHKVYLALRETNARYPFLSYGYDWLAFAHLVIAIAFIGPLRDPIKNKWVIQFGIVACCMIFPLAFIAGTIRKIPIYWRLIDCSFGVIGLIPLLICYSKIK